MSQDTIKKNIHFEQGEKYFNDFRLENNLELAFDCFTKAAAEGCADAMARLGIFFQNGMYVDMDKDAARHYYELAAEKGSSTAFLNLAALELTSDEHNYEKAWEYTQKAKELDKVKALSLESYFYANGWVVEKDIEKANALIKESAEAGYWKAKLHYAEILKAGYFCEPDPDKAIELILSELETPNPYALYDAAKLYAEGYGTIDKNEDLALELFQYGVRYKDTQCCKALANYYRMPDNPKADSFKSHEYIMIAAEIGDADAEAQAGWNFATGDGTAKDIDKASHSTGKLFLMGSPVLLHGGIMYFWKTIC